MWQIPEFHGLAQHYASLLPGLVYNFAYLFSDAQCFYGNRVYNSEESFPSSDGCNACFCSNGVVGCTWRLCPPAGISQKIYTQKNNLFILFIYTIFQEGDIFSLTASLPYLPKYLPKLKDI